MRHNIFIILIFFLLVTRVSIAIESTINFMWTYPKYKPEEELIFPKERFKTTVNFEKEAVSWNIKTIDDWMVPWLKQNSDGHFVFWYDGSTVSDAQIIKTQKVFEKLKTQYLTAGGQLNLRNVRDLTIVKDNARIFSQDTPLYLKVDLFRIIAALESVKSCQTECVFVYSDVDKGLKKLSDGSYQSLGLAKNDLLNEKAIRELKDIGLILNNGTENSFFILGNLNYLMLDAIDEAVIKSNMERIILIQDDIRIYKKLMASNSILKKNVEDLSYEAVNRVYDSMINMLFVYFKHLNKEIEMVPDPSFGHQKMYMIFSKIDPSIFRNIKNNFAINGNVKIAFPAIDMGGAPTESYKVSEDTKKAIFGELLYTEWLKNYETISEDEIITRYIGGYLILKGYIGGNATISSTIPKTAVKAEKIFFINDGEKKWVAKLFKEKEKLEYQKEARLIEKHRQMIEEIPKLNSEGLSIPHLVKSFIAFTAGNQGVIFMEKALGETLSDIFEDLPNLENGDITAIFGEIGRQYGNLQAIFVAKKNKAFYSYDQHLANILFDKNEMKSYWIDLDLREDNNLDELGLMNTIDKDSYLYEITQSYYQRKFARLGWDKGLKKYFLAISSLVNGYNTAFEEQLSKANISLLTNEPSLRLNKQITLMIKNSLHIFSDIEKNRKLQELQQKVEDLNKQEIMELFKAITPWFKGITDIERLMHLTK